MLADLVLVGIVILVVAVVVKVKWGKGIMGKVSNVAREGIDSAKDALSDTKRDGKYAIQDAETELDKFTTQISDLKAQTIRLKNEKKEVEAKISNMAKVSEAAAKAGNSDDVRAALVQKKTFENKLAVLVEQIEANEALDEKLMHQKNTLQEKIESAKNDLETLTVRDESASLRAELAKSVSGLSSSSALGNLEELKQKVAKKESQAEALEEMAASSDKPASLTEKYAAGNEDVDDEVAALLAKHQKSE